MKEKPEFGLVTSHRDYNLYYTDHMKERLTERYSVDMDFNEVVTKMFHIFIDKYIEYGYIVWSQNKYFVFNNGLNQGILLRRKSKYKFVVMTIYPTGNKPKFHKGLSFVEV